jgi:hypothetical protein
VRTARSILSALECHIDFGNSGKRKASASVPEAGTASEDEIRHLRLLFERYFESRKESDYKITKRLSNQADGVPPPGNDYFCTTGDLGTENQALKTARQLSGELSFSSGRPAIFNKRRSLRSSVHDWDTPGETSKVKTEKLRLHWVQLAGVAAMVEKSFSGSVSSPTSGVGLLLADAVGVGKTAQVMAFIAFMIHVWHAEQDKNTLRPPIIGRRSSLIYSGVS